MPNEHKKNRQLEREQVKEARFAEKKELILQRQKMKSELHKSRLKRDNLLSNLSKKMAKAKLTETQLRAQLREQAIKEKKQISKEKEDDRIEISAQRKLIREKQSDIQSERKAIKQELLITSLEIKNEKMANRKKNIEEKASFRAVKNEQRIKHRAEANELKIKNRELKMLLEEKRLIQKNKNAEKLIQSKKDIAEEKIRISKEKEKLKNIKNEKSAIAKAKRLEKLEKAKDEKMKLNLEKAKAKELHRQEILNIKSNRILNETKNTIEINKEKELYDIKLAEINSNIEAEKEEIIKNKDNAREIINAPTVEKTKENQTVKDTEDFSDNYVSVFSNEIKPEEESYREQVAGSVIHSFGKLGANKFKIAQTPSIETDIQKYKKDFITTSMVKQFRESSSEAIDVKSLVGYVEIIMDKRFEPKSIDSFHAHAITAILTNHAVRFADGFITSLKSGKKLILEFSRELRDSSTLVEFENKEVGEEINKLITKKIMAGGMILLAEGLLAVKETNGIRFLQDTNFMKA